MKKLLSIFALIALIICLLTVQVFAVDEPIVDAPEIDNTETDAELPENESPEEETKNSDVDNGDADTQPPESEATLDYILENIESIIDSSLEKVKDAEIEDWRTYIEKTLIPAAVTAISAIAAFYVATLPLTKRIKKALEYVTGIAGLFKKATTDVNAVNNASVENQKDVAELKEDVKYLKEHIENIEKIERIGFGNMKELVVGGFASEIGKVGNDGENAS